MTLRGKLVRRSGTTLIFGTRNTPEWKPIEMSGSLNPDQLVEGNYYEIDVEQNTLVGYRPLARLSGGGGGGYGGGSGPSPAPSGANAPAHSNAIPAQSLMASATGFAKSAMEGGLCKTYEEAARAGLAWARLWGPAPHFQQEKPANPTPAPATAPSPMPEYPDEPNDEIPF